MYTSGTLITMSLIFLGFTRLFISIMGISLLYDDANPAITYYGPQWTHSTDVGSVFNGTISFCNTEIQNPTPPPSLSLNFYGRY